MPQNVRMPSSPSGRAVLAPRRPTAVRVVATVAVMAVVMLTAAWVGTEVVMVTETIRSLDVRAVEATTAWTLQQDAEPPLLVWSEITMPWVLYLGLGILAAGLCTTGLARRRAVWVVPIALAGWGFGVLCKLIVARPRPTPEEAITHVGSYSYPSGHALNSTTAMILLTWLLWPVLRRAWQRIVLVLVAVTVVGLTCLDRVFLGVHYPSDVLTGVLVGSLMTTAAIIGVRDGRASPARSSRSRRPPDRARQV